MFDREPAEGAWALERLEVELLQATLTSPGRLSLDREALLRWALGLARLAWREELVGDPVAAAYRRQVQGSLWPHFAGSRVDLDGLSARIPALAEDAARFREELPLRHPGLDPWAVDEEIRNKRLVLALGGGGATAYAHLGALSLLAEGEITPALLAGSSMGAVVALFRARRASFDLGEILGAFRGLSFSQLFRMLSTESRYGLPAPLRLHLRAGISRYFQREDGTPLALGELPIPTLITVSGLRRGMLPRPLSYYEELLGSPAPKGWLPRRALGRIAEAVELLTRPQVLKGIPLGEGSWTREIDAVDAAGFSCALPGVIHYDVLRPDPAARERFDRLFLEHDLLRLVDGGLTENVPAEAAWQQVRAGALGHRNVVILALDPFAPRLTTPLWLPLQRIAKENVQPSLRRAHLAVAYRNTLSPTDLLPSLTNLLRAVEWGRDALRPSMPLLRRLLDPLPSFHALLPQRQRVVARR